MSIRIECIKCRDTLEKGIYIGSDTLCPTCASLYDLSVISNEDTIGMSTKVIMTWELAYRTSLDTTCPDCGDRLPVLWYLANGRCNSCDQVALYGVGDIDHGTTTTITKETV